MINPDSAVNGFFRDLAAAGLPVHSVLMAKDKTVFCESYCPPYGADTLHRMFSITKSFVSLAVGFLEVEGLISLADRIIDYFPEYLPADSKAVHPWLAEMTIEHMLKMETCHSATTYDKFSTAENWVESFFVKTPDHRPGTVFNYDTSSPHTLSALVEKLTGKRLLNYLREICLDGIGFSKEAYILADPFGVSMGGSGLMALPSDLIKFGFYLMDMRKGGYPISDYIEKAASFQAATVMNADIPEQTYGYGYQFWRLSHRGFACYGMGGQFLLMYPDQDLICVTTADTQGMSGANQRIFDSFRQRILEPLCTGELTGESLLSGSRETADSETVERPAGDTLLVTPVSSPWAPRYGHGLLPSLPLVPNHYPPENPGDYDGKVWQLQNHFLGCDRLCLDLSDGSLTFLGAAGKEIHLPFSTSGFSYGTFPVYDMTCAASASWIAPDTLYIRVWLLDTSIGSVHIQLHFSGPDVTVYMKKVEETMFQEFTGYLHGTCRD